MQLWDDVNSGKFQQKCPLSGPDGRFEAKNCFSKTAKDISHVCAARKGGIECEAEVFC